MSAKINGITATSMSKLDLATHRRQSALFINKVSVLLKQGRKTPSNTKMMAFISVDPGNPGEAGQVVVFGGGGPPHKMLAANLASQF
jgi:hypothetical protein